MLPARDEAASVGAMVGDARAALERWEGGGEVLVVDDGSRDATAAEVRAAAAGDARVRLLGHPAPRGYGAALRTGFAAARGGWVCFTDADRQFDLRELPLLEAWAGLAPLVVGYRARRRDPWGRRLCGWGWSRVCGLALGTGVRDVDCAFKLVRRDLLHALPLRSAGAAVNAELLARARRAGVPVIEVGVSHRPRRAGRASGARPAVVLRATWELARLYPELGGG